MANVESLVVYTVPSSFVRSWHRRFPTDYARVVGLRPAGGDTVWALQPAVGDSSGSTTANDAAERTLQVSGDFAHRVSDYFLDNLTETARNRGNCHYFGRWMIGAADGTVAPDLSEPVNLVNDGTFVDRGVLALGQRGVIGSRFRGFPKAPHSIVGLGLDDECIQVMSPEGYLGITRYDAIYDYYSITGPAAESGNYSDFGLYI